MSKKKLHFSCNVLKGIFVHVRQAKNLHWHILESQAWKVSSCGQRKFISDHTIDWLQSPVTYSYILCGAEICRLHKQKTMISPWKALDGEATYYFWCNFLKQIWEYIKYITCANAWQNQQNGCAPSEHSDQPGHRPSWSESSLSTWRKIGSLATHWVHSEDWSDWADAQADLIAGRTSILLVLSCARSYVSNLPRKCHNDEAQPSRWNKRRWEEE